MWNGSRARLSVAAASALALFAAACNVAGTDDEGYVVLDAEARRAGLTVEVSGEGRSGLLPVAVTSEQTAILSRPLGREAIDLAPGEVAYVRGREGVIERGSPERDMLRVSAAEAPARVFGERMGIVPVQSAAGRWLFRGADVLPITALFFEEPKGIYAVEPVFTPRASRERGKGKGQADSDRRDDARARAEAAEEEEALSDFVAEHTGAADDAEPELSPEEARLARERIEKSLEIGLSLPGKRVFEVGESIPLSAEIVNHAWGLFWVVKPGDGSEMGWREPYVYLTAQEEQSPGVWVDVPKARYSRCGNYDEAWDKDLVRLAPGEALKLERLLPPEVALDLQNEGRVRLYAHYQYRGGKGQRGLFERGARVPHELAGVPAYELTSAPMEIRIVRPMDVVLTPKASFPLDPSMSVDSAIDVSVINRSSAPITVAGQVKGDEAGERTVIFFEEDDERPAWPSGWWNLKVSFEGRRTLQPGARLSLLGAGQVQADVPRSRGHAQATARIRADVILYLPGGERFRSVKSSWIDVEVLPVKSSELD